MSTPNFENRTLYHGDNLEFLRGMNSNTIDLIATDPPFNKNRDFHATPDSLSAGASFQDRWSWRDDIHDDWLTEIMEDHYEVWHAINAAKIVYGYDMAAYLCWLGVRLLEMRRILKPTGSIFLHCDSTASHYIKMLMDAVFGQGNFRNQLIWRRSTAHNSANRFGNIVDHLLYYAPPNGATWNPFEIATPKSEDELKKAYPSTDERGRFRAENLTGANLSAGESGVTWRDYDVASRNRHWAPPKSGAYAKYIEKHFIPGYSEIQGVHERLDALDEAGLIRHPVKGVWPGLKRYAAADQGIPPQNLILRPIGFTNYSTRTGEYTGYPTQKPVALYERLIKVSSNPGDWVLDPFCGCATTPIASERLERKWVGIDLWDKAHGMVLERMAANRQMLSEADPVIHFSKQPPARTDKGSAEVLRLETPTGRKRKRYPPPRTQHGRLVQDIGPYCQGCGRDYNFDPRVLEVDHIMPRADGGTDAYSNLTLLCPPCNREKKDRLTLSGLQQANRQSGHLPKERECFIRVGGASRRRRPRRRRR